MAQQPAPYKFSYLASLNLYHPRHHYFIMVELVHDMPDREGFAYTLREIRDGGGDNSSIGCGPDIRTIGRYMTRAAGMRDFEARCKLVRANNPELKDMSDG